MSIFNRVAGTEEPKIPVWPIMMDFTRVLDGEMTIAELATVYELTAEEQTEAQQYLTRIGELVAERVAELVALGISQELSTILARGSVDNQLRYGLLRAEHGTITETELKTNLGV
jgi:hypothetical protein